MIAGEVNSDLEAVIPLVVQGQSGEVPIEAVIDTGYSYFLTLPAEMIASLGLEQIGTGILTLADGGRINAAICQATVLWDGASRDIDVDVLETTPLVGMALMKGYELNASIFAGGQVTLTACKPGT